MFLAFRVPVAGIEAFERVKGKWFCLTRTPNNFFSSEGMGAVSFPLKVRLTSIMNEHLEATIETLKNDVVINSDIQFSDTKVRGKRYKTPRDYKGKSVNPPYIIPKVIPLKLFLDIVPSSSAYVTRALRG